MCFELQSLVLPFRCKNNFCSRELKHCESVQGQNDFLEDEYFVRGFSVHLFHFRVSQLLLFQSVRSAILRDDDICAEQYVPCARGHFTCCHRFESLTEEFSTTGARDRKTKVQGRFRAGSKQGTAQRYARKSPIELGNSSDSRAYFIVYISRFTLQIFPRFELILTKAYRNIPTQPWKG